MADNRSERRSTVSMARITDQDMSEDSLKEVIQQALQPLGGLGRFVSAGRKVLLKPNQTLWKSALKGSTTSPRLIRALIGMCFDAGAREVWVAEASGHAQSSRRVMALTGMTSAVQGTGAHLIYMDEIAEQVYDFGEDAGDLRYMPAPEILERADVIINVPKAKTHFVDPVSGACKNWVGVMPMSYRLVLQRQGDPYYRGNALLLRKFRPHLNIMDGGIAGEGQGPGGNEPFWWGWILASEDPVAMDVMLCQFWGLPWGKIRMAHEAYELGIGVFDPTRIDLVGASIEEARVPVKPAEPSVHRYPCNVITGPSSTIEGSLGHWKTIADAWLRSDLWTLFTSKGRPTFLFDDGDDPDFEKHLQQGPYVVLGDKAKDQYKYDPRVVYVPGDPVPQSYIQNEMVEGMGFGMIYEPGLRMYEAGQAMMGRLGGASGPEVRKKTWAKLLGMAAIGIALPMAVRAMMKPCED